MCAVLGVFFGFTEMHPRPGGWASFRKENLGGLASRKLCGLLGPLPGCEHSRAASVMMRLK
jgi:hypothetical protein